MYIICNNVCLHVVDDKEAKVFHRGKLKSSVGLNRYILVTDENNKSMFKYKEKHYTDVVYKIAEEKVFGDSNIQINVITKEERDHLWQNSPACSWREFAMMKDYKVINRILNADYFEINGWRFRKDSLEDMMILLFALKGEYKDINRVKFCLEEEYEGVKQLLK